MRHRPVLLGGLLCGSLLMALYLFNILSENRYKRWIFSPEQAITNAPALCRDGTVLIGSDRPLFALDGDTGHLKWTFNFPTDNEYQSTLPIIGTGNTVYLGSQVNNKPYRLYALNGATGEVRWSRRAEAAVPVVGEDNQIFVGGKRLLALDSRTGRQRWAFQPPASANVGDPNSDNDDGQIKNAAYANGTVLVAFGCPDQRLFALDAATGKSKWSLPLEDKLRFACSLPIALRVINKELVLVGETGGALRALDIGTGRLKWRFQTDGDPLYVSAVSDQHSVYVTTYEGNLCALDGQTGALRWNRDLGEKIADAAVGDAGRTLYVGTGSNHIYALDSGTGQTQWSLSFGWLTRSFPYGDSVEIAAGSGGRVYAASTDGHFYALQSP